MSISIGFLILSVSCIVAVCCSAAFFMFYGLAWFIKNHPFKEGKK